MSLLKHIILLLFVGSGVPSKAQPLSNQPEQDACNAISICGNFSCPYIYHGYGNAIEHEYYYNGCFTESNSVWLRLKIGSSGVLVFKIIPYNPSNNFDFAISENIPCYQVASFPSICNSGYLPGGLTGLTTGSTSSAFAGQISVTAGGEYLILIDNQFNNNFPSNYANGFSIDFTGSTATFINDSLPRYEAIKATCNKSQVVNLELNEPVFCSSIAADGSDFYITPSVGLPVSAYGFNCTQVSSTNAYTSEVTIEFDAPLPPGNYWLHARTGIDGNTLRDLCNGVQPLLDSIEFTVEPYSPVTFTGFEQPTCQFLLVGLSHKVLCDSIASDGSDFKVVGPSNVSVGAASGTNCDIFGLADTVLIALQAPISVDGTYQLWAQKGSDNNTLIDSCTGRQLVGDHIDFHVDSYGGALQLGPDTLFCHADTIQLVANNMSWMSANNCGVEAPSHDNGCFSVTREIIGEPGTEFYTTFLPTNLFCNDRGFKKQMLFHASELQEQGLKAGRITRIGWTVDPAFQSVISFPPPPCSPIPYMTYNDITIRIGCVNVFDLGSFVPDLKVVYSATAFTPNDGLVELMLDSAYTWDGLSNIIVEVCAGATQLSFNCGPLNPFTYYAAAPVKQSVTNFNSSISSFSSQIDGCSLTNGVTNNSRPDTRFTICGPPLPLGGLYQWRPLSYTIGDTSSSSVTVFTPTTTVFTVCTTDRFGCLLRDTATITISNLNASVNPKDTTICLGDMVVLTSDAGTAPANYFWLTNVPASLNCLNCAEPIAKPQDTTSYTAIVSDQYGCADTLTVLINVLRLPMVIAFPEDTIIKYGNSIQLEATGGYLYSWSPLNTLSDNSLPNPIASPLEPEEYIVTAFDSNGCRNSDTVHIYLDYRDHVFIPSIFSPNGDGRNDVFRVVNLTFQRIQEFKVFNRWGQIVYSGQDNKGWDGTKNGVAQDIGVYQYLIRIGYPDGNAETYKGNVSLIK